MRAPRNALPYRRALGAIGVALTLALALSGCAGDGTEADEKSSASGVTKGSGGESDSTSEKKDDEAGEPVLGKPAKDEVPTFVGVQHKLPAGKALKNVPDLYEQVALTGCEATDGGWAATGTAGNESGEDLRLTVLVLFTDAQARIVDSAATTVAVPAGGNETWTAERAFAAPVGTQCLVRAVSQEK
ncbi:hypothetical protein RB608_06525 [Nocardioides sp. LHD-245]|uniref:hypothetical protein n=1 Tax=Nocardioides sp. LHD-245 TaxID=3051387 RepID=UPI0027E20CE0|nr:hypothetical protein [Nocardioides sp. LHD-245]